MEQPRADHQLAERFERHRVAQEVHDRCAIQQDEPGLLPRVAVQRRARPVANRQVRVPRRPLTIPPEIAVHGPWQGAATTFPASSMARTKLNTSLIWRTRSGASWPPGRITRS